MQIAHINLCKFPVIGIYLRREVFGLALVLGFGLMPVRQTTQVNSRSQILLINGNFSQRGFLAARLQIVLSSCDCDDVVMCVDNNGFRHNCEELVQGFEKFVVMAMNPGADLDSLPILDNPDNFKFVVHAYAAFILERSYVAINDLPQLNSSKSYSNRSITKQRLFISRIPDFWFLYLLGITDRKSSWC